MSENKIELSGIFSEGYGFVPKKLMKSKNISSNTKLILCYLLSYTGAGMNCFPQIKNMSEDLGVTTRTIIRCINSAIENGFLKKHQQNRGRGIGKKNTYELLFMYDFKNNKEKITCDNISHEKLSCDKEAISCDNNNNYHVTQGQSNNNIDNNNIINNNNEKTTLLTKIETLYKDSIKMVIPEYDVKKDYNFGKNRKIIKTLLDKHGYDKLETMLGRYFKNDIGRKSGYALTSLLQDWIWNNLLQNDVVKQQPKTFGQMEDEEIAKYQAWTVGEYKRRAEKKALENKEVKKIAEAKC